MSGTFSTTRTLVTQSFFLQIICVIISGLIVSCSSAAIQIRIRIVQYEQPAQHQKHKPCETKARFLPPLLRVGSQELVLQVPSRGQFQAAIRMTTKRSDSCLAALKRCDLYASVLRFSCVCVLKTLRFKTLRSRGTKGKRPMRFGELRAKMQRIQLRFAI